ncbi:ABC transporter permease [Saccharomonospora piscinae]|uniref:ABC transporter permease n=1 Tax=Saccharomonospora piscinae TaxID=687388 RepID=UPI001106BBA0|nr:ABC transporter permease [Saccharomonospora piscinae]TLW93103.1 ABC transporter permease [Saccharomonospora piscinae]
MTAATATPTRTGTSGVLTGTGHLVRLGVRRDRLALPLWGLVLAVLPATSAGAYEQLYPSAAQRAALTTSMGDNPSITLLYGPAFDLSTAGGFTAWRFGTLLSLLLALVCVFTMTRHTRQEEDTGRQELLAAAVLGRHASLTASLLVCTGFSLVTGALSALAMISTGMAATGAIAFGLGLASVAWVFTGVAAVTAQLAEYARTANGLAGAVLGTAFALRAVGDSSSELSWLSWTSPIGWATRVRPFAGDHLELLALPLVATAVLIALAYGLERRRDVGLGLLPTSLGPAEASPLLRSPLALAARLHRGSLTGWLVGLAMLSVLFGALASDFGDIVGDNQQMREILARMGGSQGVIDAYLASVANMLGMVVALFAVQAALRMRAEEIAVRAEPLLTVGVSRLRWLAGHLVFVFGGAAAMSLATGLGMGLAHGIRSGDVAGQTGEVLLACLVQLPAVFVVAGVAVALVGFLPAQATFAWAVAAASLLLSMFGAVLDLPQAVLDVSPFQHVPKLPSVEFTATPMLWLSLVAAALTTAGIAGFRRRDIG